ncbi:membrane protein [Streptococcus pneumoniae]|nr:membrane protein [Streptococcus pneumoniae]
MSNLFNSIFNDTTATADPIQLFLALFVSLILGLALTWAYKHRTLYTREFAVSLTLLPCLMTLVIFLVNGSLGTSIAVAGTFSLIRFRSATSGSRELIAIFLAMIIGLASGTGYLALAVLFTVFILAVWLLLEKQQSKNNHQRRRLLTITITNQEKQLQTIQSGLSQFCTELDLISIDTSNDGEQVTTVYEVDFKAQTDDFQIIHYLTKEQDTYQVSLTKNAKKRKNL